MLLIVTATVLHLAGSGLLVLGVVRVGSGAVADGAAICLLSLWLCPWVKRRGAPDRVLAPVPEAVVEWVSGLSDQLGGRRVDDIEIVTGTVAATSRSLSGRRRLHLGVEMFVRLDPEERDAAIAHELGHWSGADPSRRLWVEMAISAIEGPLRRVGLLVAQEPSVRHEVVVTDGNTAVGMMLLRMAVTPLLLVHLLMEWLSVEDRLEAEYSSDYAAARVVGTDCMMKTLRVLSSGADFDAAVRRQIVDRVPVIDWQRVREALAAVPEDEVTRRLIVDEIRQMRRSHSHPPTLARIRVLSRWPVTATLSSTTLATHESVENAVAPCVEAWSIQISQAW